MEHPGTGPFTLCGECWLPISSSVWIVPGPVACFGRCQRCRSREPARNLVGTRLGGRRGHWIGAYEGYARFYWVSSPEAAHSRNIATRAEVAIVIFDSRTPSCSGQGVHVSAVAQELTGADPESGIALFSCRSESHGADEWTAEDVRPSPPVPGHRLGALRAGRTRPADAGNLV
jgi:hypothetical protein